MVLETSGIGQSDTEIMDHSDVSLYVMTPEFGAATQLEKIDMLDFADVVAINKFDKRGAQDALRDVRKQFKRNHDLWEANENLPVVGTIASQFNDPGTNELYRRMMNTLAEKTGAELHSTFAAEQGTSEKVFIIPPSRTRYLSEIAESNRAYDRWAENNRSLQAASKPFNLRLKKSTVMQRHSNKPGRSTEARPRRPLARLASGVADHAKTLCRRRVHLSGPKKGNPHS